MFVFSFRCSWDTKRVLEGGPWSFDKCLLVLKEPVGVGKIEDLDFSLTSFWVQIYNLPLAYINREVGMFLGKMISEIREVDSGLGGKCLGKCLSVRVWLNVNEPLKMGLRVVIGDDGMECTVLFCYKRLPNFYYRCGKMGHLLRECNDYKGGVADAEDLKFGGWLKAQSLTRLNNSRGRKTEGNDFKSSKSNGGRSVSTAEVSGVSLNDDGEGGKIANEVYARDLAGSLSNKLGTVSVEINKVVVEVVSSQEVSRIIGETIVDAIVVEEVTRAAANVALKNGKVVNHEEGPIVSSNSVGLSLF
ncbi:hypothetical protein ACOSP7_010133 [Xanthoceras sorbifolium]